MNIYTFGDSVFKGVKKVDTVYRSIIFVDQWKHLCQN